MIKIREATLKDLNILVELLQEFEKEHSEIVKEKNSRLNDLFVEKSNASNIKKKYMEKSILSRKTIIHLVENGSTAIAYCFLEIKKDIPIYKNKEFGRIGQLYIKKGYRGMKISYMLYAEAKKWFRSKGIEFINIGVHPANERAHLIYKNWGFSDFHIEMREKI